ADEDNGSADPAAGAGVSLREAIALANKNPGADTITFAVAGTISLGGTQLPAISSDLTIAGPAGGLTIDARGASRIFQVSAGAVSLNGLTLANGSADSGGGISNAATLALTDCTLAVNFASYQGGGIDNGGALSLTNCTLTGNVAGSIGGGIS